MPEIWEKQIGFVEDVTGKALVLGEVSTIFNLLNFLVLVLVLDVSAAQCCSIVNLAVHFHEASKHWLYYMLK
jgi:hypothetical protein